MDRDQSIKMNDTLTAIKTALTGIKSALDTIAVNTTPADSDEPDAEPTANTATRSAKK